MPLKWRGSTSKIERSPSDSSFCERGGVLVFQRQSPAALIPFLFQVQGRPGGKLLGPSHWPLPGNMPSGPAFRSNKSASEIVLFSVGGTLARWGALPKGKRLGQSPPCLPNSAAH